MLYRTRARRRSVVERVLVRAFDKAVRRKPLAFAADAVGLWELQVGEGGPGTMLSMDDGSTIAPLSKGQNGILTQIEIEGARRCRIHNLAMEEIDLTAELFSRLRALRPRSG